jgi:hypothetical protein
LWEVIGLKNDDSKGLMATLAQATAPRNTSNLVPVPAPTAVPSGIPSPVNPQDLINPFLMCPHPLAPTVDAIRQFYRNGTPQIRTNLFVEFT